MESCKGLSSADAQQRLTQYGPNVAVEEKRKPPSAPSC
ncbi:MAG: cation-transporting P-type ATPase [Acidithiobacillus sp.]|nr:cation-transporting P-type ATPase [Acidithiobacillus sp.]